MTYESCTLHGECRLTGYVVLDSPDYRDMYRYDFAGFEQILWRNVCLLISLLHVYLARSRFAPWYPTAMKIKLLSWNVEGLRDQDIDMRSEAIVFRSVLGMPLEAVDEESGDESSPPDFMFFQEVTDRMLQAHFGPHLTKMGFTVFPQASASRSYFEVMAVRQPWKVISAEVSPFTTTEMGRELLTAEVEGPIPLKLMTSHLESLREGKVARLAQMDELHRALVGDGLSIFAGDTNLREKEWQKLKKGSFSGTDAFEAFGSPKEAKSTWRTRDHKIKARYDRMWTSKQVGIESFNTSFYDELSDHAAVEVEFSVEVNT